ncbi:MAG: MFS transporter [Hamadaea sp.]|uniref:MDR family MFS transporter n=1 Tax=Hamadaea sp. TaxID=2024425 RepID=UPI0018579C39|nr:MFS transporter [Hamadaea sp.]NUR73875.1 MFS transporter [Hamadaea sp.]NUT19264.1 MFS transporter [Hamadaea sp.]
MRSLRTWAGDTVGGLPATFWYLWLGTLINRLGAVAVLFLEIHMVSGYGFSATLAGLVLGLYGGGMALGSIAGGVLADRWGRRPTLLLANIAGVVTALALGITLTPWFVALIALVYGFWNGLGRPAYSATLVDVLGPTKRMRGMNLNYWAINLGFSGAAFLAGVLAHTPRMVVFVLNASVLAITTVIIAVKVPETSPGPALSAPKERGGLGLVLRDRIFMTYVLLNLGLWSIIESCKLIPIAMVNRGIDPANYGTVIAVNGIMIVALQLFIPKLVGRHPRNRVQITSALLVGLGMGAVGLAGSVPTLALTVAVWTLGEMINAPVNGTTIADLSSPTMRGRYQGVASMSFTAANFFAPIIGGVVLDRTAPATLWFGLGVLGLVVAAGHLASGPARERRAVQLTQPEGVRDEALVA